MPRFVLFIFIIGACLVTAKPMTAPTLDEAMKSKWIVLVEYQGYEKSAHLDYFGYVETSYTVLDVLKGEKLDKKIQVRYRFHDGSACLVPEWKFDEKKLPKKSSRWILFLSSKDAEFYEVYRGDFGRMEATPEILKTIQSKLVSK